MTTAAWITLATALLTLFLLVKTRIKMDAVFIMCMAILLFTGVLSEEQTFRGFVSRGALVIVFLGHITNVMVRGQYSRSELWRYGWPFALIMFVVIVLSVTLFYPFH